MESKHVKLGATVIRALLDAQQRIAEVKFLYLKIVEAHSVPEPAKAEYKERIGALSSFIHEFFGRLRTRDVNKFNVDDFEETIASFLRDLTGKVKHLKKHGRALTPLPPDLRVLPVGDEEMDAALRDARVLGQPAMELDKLDRLGSVRRFLLEVAPAPESAPPKSEALRDKVDSELVQLKLRNYEQTFARNTSSNLDILFKVATRLSRYLTQKVRLNVVDGDNGPDAHANFGELYVTDHQNANLSVFFKEPSLSVLLDILLTHRSPGEEARYRGEISGWAEAGVNRVEFLLRDCEPAPGGNPEDPRVAAVIEQFLSKAEFAESYHALRAACAAKTREADQLRERVDREAKERVSKALDSLL